MKFRFFEGIWGVFALGNADTNKKAPIKSGLCLLKKTSAQD